uniref:Transmembrane 9 superfamily member n=1 Tax=Kalanchoe fedtschenkoi TaxID=63787 RepID=A0A7N0U8G9_KALFE
MVIVSPIHSIRDAISNDFYYQMYYDDLPFWGFIGKIENSWLQEENNPKYYLFNHVRFNAFYNDDQVVEIRAWNDPKNVVDITADQEIDVQFTYSVIWNKTSIPFANRLDRYTRASSLQPHSTIHWFSVLNSIVIIVLLTALLALLFMRHLKNDLIKCSSEEGDEEGEVAWKYLHGDVFRCPRYTSLFSAVLGAGSQIFSLLCVLFLLAFLDVLYAYSRGSLCTSLAVGYALTSFVAGYSSSSFHNQLSATGWERSVVLSGLLYLGPVFVIMCIFNTVAIFYGATTALPFGTIVLVILMSIFITAPLLALGGAVGYRLRSEFKAPCPTKRVPREIRSLAWYRTTPGQMLIGGLLPFGTIAMELHNLLLSLWGYKIFTTPSILFIMFLILTVLTIMLSIGLTYIQLSAEDHEWWWRSILRGGSTAVFVFANCIVFYARSDMHGFLQLFFFLGYSACMCYALFLMLGTISFHASLIFVRRIYSAVKSE